MNFGCCSEVKTKIKLTYSIAIKTITIFHTWKWKFNLKKFEIPWSSEQLSVISNARKIGLQGSSSSSTDSKIKWNKKKYSQFDTSFYRVFFKWCTERERERLMIKSVNTVFNQMILKIIKISKKLVNFNLTFRSNAKFQRFNFKFFFIFSFPFAAATPNSNRMNRFLLS